MNIWFLFKNNTILCTIIVRVLFSVTFFKYGFWKKFSYAFNTYLCWTHLFWNAERSCVINSFSWWVNPFLCVIHADPFEICLLYIKCMHLINESEMTGVQNGEFFISYRAMYQDIRNAIEHLYETVYIYK